MVCIVASNMRILLGVLQKLSVEQLGAKLNWQTLTYISIILNTCETECHDVQACSPVTCLFEIWSYGSTSKFESSYYWIKADELPPCQLAWFTPVWCACMVNKEPFYITFLETLYLNDHASLISKYRQWKRSLTSWWWA